MAAAIAPLWKNTMATLPLEIYLLTTHVKAALSVPIPIMIDLLQQWDEVCKINPAAVTIYYENEKFRIEVQQSGDIL